MIVNNTCESLCMYKMYVRLIIFIAEFNVMYRDAYIVQCLLVFKS